MISSIKITELFFCEKCWWIVRALTVIKTNKKRMIHGCSTPAYVMVLTIVSVLWPFQFNGSKTKTLLASSRSFDMAPSLLRVCHRVKLMMLYQFHRYTVRFHVKVEIIDTDEVDHAIRGCERYPWLSADKSKTEWHQRKALCFVAKA